MRKSQRNKRRAAGREALRGMGVEPGGGQAGARGDAAQTSRSVAISRQSGPILLTPTEQMGLLALVGVSYAAYNKIRLAFGGARSGMASTAALRAARRDLDLSPAKQVVVDGTGAHLVSLAAAVQEKVSALVRSGEFVERYVYDESLQPVAKTGGFEPAPAAQPPGSPADSAPEVQVMLALDKGGRPSSVKIMASVINQARPNNPYNSIIVAVCPCTEDKFDDLKGMLSRHLPEVERLLREGVLVGASRRLVRLFLGGDMAALCMLFGHKGPNATQACLWCKSLKVPSRTHRRLVARFGTMQDVTGQRHLRDAAHLANRRTALADPNPPRVFQENHLSIDSRPLLVVDPRQIVPIPLHTTQGVGRRLLRLCVESVIAGGTEQAGKALAIRLADLLHEHARVEPEPYHGGVFSGVNYHKIGDVSDALCDALRGVVSEDSHAAHVRAWTLWNRVRKVLNRAAVTTLEEARQFRADAENFVRHLKTSFPWIYLSPKLHALFAHAADFLMHFGSIGLYAEQGMEAWHGIYNQSADRYAAATQNESAAAFVRAMAIAREASPSVLRKHAPSRAPAAAGARPAAKPGDKRRRDGKPATPDVSALVDKAKKERKKWA